MTDWSLLRHAFEPIAQFRDKLVIIGGWAFRLHQVHEWAIGVDVEPIMTVDTDLVIEPPLAGDLRTLLVGAKFQVVRDPTYSPPIEKYRRQIDDHELEIEFLANRVGGQTIRRGQNVTRTEGGVTVQLLPHLDLLITNPWTVRVPDPDAPLLVRIPNAGAFLAHKVLLLRERAPEDRAKDVRYIHETIRRFGDHLDDLRALWATQERPAVLRALRRGAGVIDRDLLERARQIASIPTPIDRFCRVLRLGFEAVLPGVMLPQAIADAGR